MTRNTRPALVEWYPFPPLEEYQLAKSRKKGTGIYYRDSALEAYAKRVNNCHFPVQQFYALDYLCWLVDDSPVPGARGRRPAAAAQGRYANTVYHGTKSSEDIVFVPIQ